MSKRNEYVEYLLEQLASLGALRAKAMFGGFGIYCDEIFFAIVADDILYLKADAQSKEDFTRLGLAPFRFMKKGGSAISMAYYPPPDAALEEQELLLFWARKAIAAALRQR